MKANRKVMLGAALVVAIVALAAVGYAATAYKSTTENTKNSIDATYVTLSQDGDAEYTNAVSFIDGIYYDTIVTSTGTAYTMVGEAAPGVTNGIKISNDKLDLILADNKDGDPNNYKITMKSSAALTPGLTYYFGLKTGTSDPVWSAGVAAASMTTGCVIASVAEGTYTVWVAVTGTPTEDPALIENITFTFVAESISASP